MGRPALQVRRWNQYALPWKGRAMCIVHRVYVFRKYVYIVDRTTNERKTEQFDNVCKECERIGPCP